MSRNHSDGHKDLLKRAFQREEAGGVARYVYYHDDKYYFVLAACTRLDLDFEAKSDRLIVPADSFESAVLDGAPLLPPQVHPVASRVENNADNEVAPPLFAAAPSAETDEAYEEEEFTFSEVRDDDDADSRISAEPVAVKPTFSPFIIDEDDSAEDDAPVFMTHQFMPETKADKEEVAPSVRAPLPAPAAEADEDEDDAFLFAASDSDDADITELRWDDTPVKAGYLPEEDQDAEVEDDAALFLETPPAPPPVASGNPDRASGVLGAAPEEPASEEQTPEAFAEEPAPVIEPAVAGAAAVPRARAPALPSEPQLSIAQVQENAVSKRAESLKAREQALLDRERAVNDREQSIVVREEDIEARRKDMGRRDRRIDRRHKDLEALERKLKARQDYLDSQRTAIENLRSATREMMEG